MGFEAENLVDDFDNITDSEVIPFRYPDNQELEQVGVRDLLELTSAGIRAPSTSRRFKNMDMRGATNSHI